jgi:hypothetical protein
MRSSKMQSVVITLDDGTMGTFTGRAITRKVEQRRIRDIKFTEPRKLPEGCEFGEIDLNKEKK